MTIRDYVFGGCIGALLLLQGCGYTEKKIVETRNDSTIIYIDGFMRTIAPDGDLDEVRFFHNASHNATGDMLSSYMFNNGECTQTIDHETRIFRDAEAKQIYTKWNDHFHRAQKRQESKDSEDNDNGRVWNQVP